MEILSICRDSGYSSLRIFIKACCLIFVEDVASISWIYASFACFIALIEIGRYRGGYSCIHHC